MLTPLHQIFKIIIFPDSTFYKLHSDIYFAKILSLARRVRTIFRWTLLRVYSNLKRAVEMSLGIAKVLVNVRNVNVFIYVIQFVN